MNKIDAMTLTALLYISTSAIAAPLADDEVRAIVAKASIDNARHEITGALLFTGNHFAQVLEGAEEDIDRLLSIISCDIRHHNLIVVDRGEIAVRRFPDWGMAYMGPSQFVARHISRLLNAPARSEKVRAANWLSDLMYEFSKH